MATLTHARQRATTIDWSFAGRIDFWIEASWLAALALIPLIFNFRSWLPTFDELKTYLLHFFAFVNLSLMSWDYALKYMEARKEGRARGESLDVMQWLRSDRSHWMLAAIIVFAFVYIASTALSPMPFYSFWGISPATSGYNLYSFLSMMVIFASMLIYVRSMDQARRILYVVAGTGTLAGIYATSQHFSWDPIGEQLNNDRVFATFGNAVVFGAYLVISIPVTIALAVERRHIEKRWPLALFGLAIGFQLAALWFTGSRGPLTGLVAGVGITGLMALTLMPRRAFIALSVTTAGALIFAGALILAPGGPSSTRSVQFGGELDNLTTEARSGYVEAGLEGRREIWREVIELSTTWERQYPDSGLSKILRPVFGYGPDMLRFSTPLVSNPRASLEIVDHAHNRPLHILAEQGWAGFISFMAVAGTALWLLILIWRALRRDQRGNTISTIVFMAVAGGLTGVAIEQMTGVGRIADIFTSWALVALLAILYQAIAKTAPDPAPAAASEPAPEMEVNMPRSKKGRRRQAAQAEQERARGSRSRQPGMAPVFAMFAAAVFVTVVSLGVFYAMDARMFMASRLFMQAYSVTDGNEAYGKFQQARDLAPHVELFAIDANKLLLDDSQELLALERHNEAADYGEVAYKDLSGYVERNPLGFYGRLTLAASAAQMVEIGVIGWDDEMIVHYEDVAQQFPNEATVLAVTANAYVATGHFEKGIEYADRSIAISEVSRPLSQPWWIKGEALLRMGDSQGAIEALSVATEQQPDSEYAAYAHRNLANIYDGFNQPELAQQHRKAADEILYNGTAPTTPENDGEIIDDPDAS